MFSFGQTFESNQSQKVNQEFFLPNTPSSLRKFANFLRKEKHFGKVFVTFQLRFYFRAIFSSFVQFG
jgi:hypothetical protein